MINPIISHNKTLFDIFNMINPNCYQALIIQAIIEDRKEEAIQLCDALSTAFEYYKWESNAKQSGYTDALICDSSLDQWKKLAIIRIISNNEILREPYDRNIGLKSQEFTYELIKKIILRIANMDWRKK